MREAKQLIERVVQGAEPRQALREASDDELVDYLDDLYDANDNTMTKMTARFRTHSLELQREKLEAPEGHTVINLALELYKALDTATRLMDKSVAAVEKYQSVHRSDPSK